MIVEAINDVCARPPAGIDHYADLLLSWVKYGVAAVIIAAGFVSVGALVVGKLGNLSRAAQMGASGLIYAVLAAVTYVTIYGILSAIIGEC
jgi:hypothetical protein